MFYAHEHGVGAAPLEARGEEATGHVPAEGFRGRVPQQRLHDGQGRPPPERHTDGPLP